MKLSVAIATFNEEKNILRCISSIYDVVDEVVVVDGTSTDTTIPLLKKFDRHKKIKILLKDNPPNFLINVQHAIDACRGDYILRLDADEVVSEKLKKEIITTIKQNNGIAYKIPRLNYFLGQPLRKGGQYPDYVTRLFKKYACKLPLNSVHDVETLDKKAVQKHYANISSTIQYLHHDLYHFPYPTFASYLEKWIRYSRLEGHKLKQNNSKLCPMLFIKQIVIKPLHWFVLTYIRHKGCMDGIPGFVFSLFSSLRFWVEYYYFIM